MTARSDSELRRRGQKKEAASSGSYCPFAPVESFLVAKVGIRERRRFGDIDRLITRPLRLLAQGTGTEPGVRKLAVSMSVLEEACVFIIA